MKRPFKKFRRFVLIDTDQDEDLSQTDTKDQSDLQSSVQDRVIINEVPSKDKQEVTSFSQQ